MHSNMTGRVISLVLFGGLTLYPAMGYSAPLDRYIEGAKKEASVRVGITIRQKVQGQGRRTKIFRRV